MPLYSIWRLVTKRSDDWLPGASFRKLETLGKRRLKSPLRAGGSLDLASEDANSTVRDANFFKRMALVQKHAHVLLVEITMAVYGAGWRHRRSVHFGACGAEGTGSGQRQAWVVVRHHFAALAPREPGPGMCNFWRIPERIWGDFSSESRIGQERGGGVTQGQECR